VRAQPLWLCSGWCSVYSSLRTIHLLCGTFAVPMMLMYAVSAVQMAHPRWFRSRPSVTEYDVILTPGAREGRSVALELMSAHGLRGEIAAVQPTDAGFTIRFVRPGSVHEVRYSRATGIAHIRGSVAGTLGMLNRLHHAAGLWPEYAPLRLWGVLVGLASLAAVGLGMTGLWMWWLRRQDRTWGLVLLGANLTFSLAVLALMRSAGP